MSLSPLSGLWIHLGGILVVFVATVLLSRLRRGKAECCAACGYDLRGRTADSLVCSECGADLRDRNAIANGKRLPSGRIKVIAAVIVLLVVSQGAYQASCLPEEAWSRMTPSFWLMRRVAANASWSNTIEVQELHWRWSSGELSDDMTQRLLATTLARHADLSRPWDGCWSKLLGDFIDRRMIDEKQYQRVMENAYSVSIDCRPAIRRGGYWTWTEHVDFTRGFASRDVVEGPRSLSVEMSPLTVGNAVLRKRRTEKYTLIGSRKVQAGSLEGILDDTKAGSYTLQGDYVFETPFPGAESHTPVRFQIKYSKPIRIVEQSEWIDQPVHDLGKKPVVEQVIFDRDPRGERCAFVRMGKGDVGLSAVVYLTQDGRTVVVGSIKTEEEGTRTLHRITMLNVERDGWDFGRPFSVELRPDPSVADGRQDHGVGRYWAEQVVVKNILVDRFRPTQPTFDAATEATILRSIKAEVSRREGQLSISLSFTRLPMPLVFSYCIQLNGRRYVRRGFETVQFAPTSLSSPLISDPDGNAASCDVILMPFHFWEAYMMLRSDPWPYELVIRNVPIETRQ